jgi:hypothetical protein
MRYQFSINNMRKLFQQRPALIRDIVNLTPEQAITLIGYNDECYAYFPDHIKSDLTVCLVYLCKRRSGSCGGEVPEEVFAKFTMEQRAELISKRPAHISRLPNPTKAEYITAISAGNYAQCTDPDLILEEGVLEAYVARSGYIPAELYERVSTERLTQIVKDHPSIFCNIPVPWITPEILKMAVENSVPGFSLQHGLPDSVWTRDLVKMALEKNTSYPTYLPKCFLDEELCILYARLSGNTNIDELPVHTKPVLIEWVKHHGYGGHDIPEMKDEAFLKELVDISEGTCTHLINASFIKPELSPLFLYVLSKYPGNINRIPRADQTDEMIDVIVENASAEQIDGIVGVLNLSKIKKKHAPFLINCKNPVLISLVERKFRGHRQQAPVVQSGDQENALEINLSPGEYNELKKKGYIS